MRTGIATALATGLSVILATAASAQVQYLSDQRSLELSASLRAGDDEPEGEQRRAVPVDPFAPFSENLLVTRELDDAVVTVNGTQASSVDPLVMSANGFASVRTNAGDSGLVAARGDVLSYVQIAFRTEQPYRATFSGEIRNGGGGDLGTAVAALINGDFFLGEFDFGTQVQTSRTEAETVPISFVAVLPPDFYNFAALAFADSNAPEALAFSGFDVTLTLAPVPLPAAAWLLLSALATGGLLRVARRR